jgi:probable phosphoglycerate mutase
MPKHITLIRHGESQHHVKGLTGGWTDTGLTEQGNRQAEAAARELATWDLGTGVELISSDLLRARETTEAITRQLKGIAPVYYSELRELNNGRAKGLTREAAKKIALPVTTPTCDWIPYPEAENWRMLSARAWGFMDKFMRASKTDYLLVVSHGLAIEGLVQWWLGLGEDYWNNVSFEFDCASFTKLTVNKHGQRVITKLNDTAHLKGI